MSPTPFGLRMQSDLRQRIAAEAEANNRSMNAEIVARLEAGGKTLRDEFAMAALAGMTGGTPGAHLRPDVCATAAYQYADAMLAARQPTPSISE